MTMKLAFAFALALFVQAAVAQTPTDSAVTDYRAARTSFGQPSLEGVWLSNFILPVEARSSSQSLVVSEAEAEKLADHEARLIETMPFMYLDPEVPGIYREAADNNGMNIVRGERRSRAVVQPADGRLPYTQSARREIDNFEALFASSPNPPQRADNYEERAAAERCLSMDAAPPVVNVQSPLPRRIIQTRDHVVIQQEQFDETRIIPFSDEPPPRGRPKLLGDSTARWEGETLVIETTNISPLNRYRVFPLIITPTASTVIERMTRVADDELLYQYTIVDPATYSEPWLAEYSLYLTDKKMYEFACHEGNYSLQYIMQAARRVDALRGSPN